MTEMHAFSIRSAAASSRCGAGLAGAAMLAALGGCVMPQARTVTSDSAEVLEFANMRASNRVPKSTGTALVGAFERFCLDSGRDPAAIGAALRRADYVAAPGQSGDSATAYVVDDRRPMVQVSDDGRFCAVVAEARTGQSARIQRLVNRRFPDAQPVEPSGPADAFTLRVSGAHDGFVALRRQVPTPTASGSRLILAIQHSQ
ncbi:MAG: hypothetical protein H6898_06725 [Rhodobacter sp.]|nr:hypothetical protein [Rhodobacter sp.]